ncbi:MAG: DUF5683 domain-containing protein [Dysgonomonas sp.]
MSRGIIICLLCLVGGVSVSLYAQQPLTADTSRVENRRQRAVDRTPVKKDSITPVIDTKNIVLTDTVILLDKKEFKPNSTRAVLYSAIFPGLGQFYNRKYWKLPIVYGGALGLIYAITWNGRVYGEYNQAFKDLVLRVPDGKYMDFLQPGQTSPDEWLNGGREGFQDALKRKKDFFRRNRDLAIIASVGVYALCMIDAYVDAQLYDFDVSPDLTMRVTPVVWGPSSYSKMAIGLQCNIIF